MMKKEEEGLMILTDYSKEIFHGQRKDVGFVVCCSSSDCHCELCVGILD